MTQEPDMGGFTSEQEKLFRLHPHEAYTFCGAGLSDFQYFDTQSDGTSRAVNDAVFLSVDSQSFKNKFKNDDYPRMSVLEKIPDSDPAKWQTHVYLPSGRVTYALPASVGAAKKPYVVSLPSGLSLDHLFDSAGEDVQTQEGFLSSLNRLKLKAFDSMMSFNPSDEKILTSDGASVDIPRASLQIIQDQNDFQKSTATFKSDLGIREVSQITHTSEFDLSDSALAPIQERLRVGFERLNVPFWKKNLQEFNRELEKNRKIEAELQSLSERLSGTLDQLSPASRDAVRTLWGESSPVDWDPSQVNTVFQKDRISQQWFTTEGAPPKQEIIEGIVVSEAARKDPVLFLSEMAAGFNRKDEYLPPDVRRAAQVLSQDSAFTEAFGRLNQLKSALRDSTSPDQFRDFASSLVQGLSNCARSLSLSPSRSKEHLNTLISLENAQSILLKDTQILAPPKSEEDYDYFEDERKELEVTLQALRATIQRLKQSIEIGPVGTTENPSRRDSGTSQSGR